MMRSLIMTSETCMLKQVIHQTWQPRRYGRAAAPEKAKTHQLFN